MGTLIDLTRLLPRAEEKTATEDEPILHCIGCGREIWPGDRVVSISRFEERVGEGMTVADLGVHWRHQEIISFCGGCGDAIDVSMVLSAVTSRRA